MSEFNPNLSLPEDEPDGPDTELFRLIVLAGVWILALLVLWENIFISGLAADEAKLARARIERDTVDVRRSAGRPVRPIRKPEPVLEDYDLGDKAYKQDLNEWKKEFSGQQWKKIEDKYRKASADWGAKNKAGKAKRELEKSKLLKKIAALKMNISEDVANLGSTPHWHLLIKTAALLALMLGLFGGWMFASRSEKVVAGLGIMLFALMLIQMALGYGNADLHLDAFKGLSGWF